MEIKIFSKSPYNFNEEKFLPNLIQFQIDSFNWFKNKGLKELLEESSPIIDSSKKIRLTFEDYFFDSPKYTEFEAKKINQSYEAPLRVKVKLTNLETKRETTQEIYFGDFPIITDRGSFIVNGVERVVVSQLIRSSGIIFNVQTHKDKKLFGAKIIPNRGAWLEFETDSQGVIWVKIDRKRKAPATAILRIFSEISSPSFLKKKSAQKELGDKNNILLETFKEADIGETKFIEETLKRDDSSDANSGFIEIYRRLRPGDLATVDNAKGLIKAMFGEERYDISAVGRWKLNQRITLSSYPATVDGYVLKDSRTVTFNDLVAIIKEIINLNNDHLAQVDDIDHLANRRLRCVGELLQNKLRVGMQRCVRIIKDRLTTLDLESFTPSQLVNARPFVAVLREFFMTSQLAQFMDQVNPLAELEHKRRISAMGPGGLSRERAGFEVRDVHPTYYGRICPIQTPEGPNIGLVGHLASFARLNEFSFLETPYRQIKNERVTEEIVYFDALREQKVNIAHSGVEIAQNGWLKEEKIEARVKGQPSITKREKIQYIDVAPSQIISISTALIPFLEHNDANRALMGSNMQRQAVPPINPESPRVLTGIEKKAACDSGYVTMAQENGEVLEVDADHIVIRHQSAAGAHLPVKKTYWLENFMRTNQFTAQVQKPRVRPGQTVKKGQLIAEGTGIAQGRIALGQNLLVAFMSWRGGNFEDAIIISERVAFTDKFTSLHIEDSSCDVRETKLGEEITTPDIPNIAEEKLKDLDEEGIVRIGAEVGPGDILVGKISPKGEQELSAEERLLRAIFGEKAREVKDTSLRMPHGKRGRVVGIKIFLREKGDKLLPGVIKTIQIEVAQIKKIMVGDKLAGRHGNKGVVSKILPLEDMPFLEDGTPIDIILNPLGVASRMNIGQILETHLGWAAQKKGFWAVSPALNGAKEEDIKTELKSAGLPEDGKVALYDGRSGLPFVEKVTVGCIYMLKLNHLVEDKIHMRSIGPYSLITQQPLGGKAQFGGQRFGEMEVWALEGYGAAHTLQEMLTIKSDDVLGRNDVYDAIIRGKKIKTPSLPVSFNVLVSELKALGLNVELKS